MAFSIRWRLVATYTLIAILAVVLVGVLALFLVERYLLRQERHYLTTSASVMAQQIEPLLSLPMAQPALEDVVLTTAFLNDVQVRVLDANEVLLIDSGSPAQLNQVTLLPARAAALRVAGKVTEGLERPSFFVQTLPAVPSRIAGGTQEVSGSVHIAAPEPVTALRPGMSSAVAVSSSGMTSTAIPFSETVVTRDIFSSVTFTAPTTAPTVAPRTFSWRVWLERLLFAPQRVVQTVEEGGAVVGYVELSSRPDFGLGALALIRRAFLLAGLGVSGIAALVALWMSRSLTAPLEDLMQATEQMHSGALSARATVHTQDEIGRLATQFNTMAARLESSFTQLAAERDALSRFVADASHELRTPITALKTFGELLLGPAGQEAQARTEFLLESQKQIERLERMTSVLLNLSRLDAGLTNLKTERVDLRDLLAAAVEPLVERAQTKHIALTLVPAPVPVLLWCNPTYLEMALRNLLDNALKFTPAGGTIQTGLHVENQTVAIWVEDTGPGISSADLPYIFDRFYRSPAVQGEEGSGLGLAIVQSIAKAHGGQVTVTSETGVGSRFVIELPLAA